MNNSRRKAIEKLTTEMKEKLEDVLVTYSERLQEILDEEQECYDNLPEGIQYSEKGETMEECISSIESVVDMTSDTDNVLDNLYINEMLETCGIELY